MSVKRPGRFGDGRPPSATTPSPVPSQGPAGPAIDKPVIAPFGERKGAPLPLLTQPMVAIETRDLIDPSQTRLDGPSQARLDSPAMALDGPTPFKLDATAVTYKKTAATLASRPKAMTEPPQIDLTQHHLPEDPDPSLALVIDPDSERSASFRVLRHHLLEIGRPQVVIVSSPREGDGKTTVAVNLALALAECGRAKTLLVETHVRRPRFTDIFKFVPPWCFAEQPAAHRHQPAMPWSLVDIPQLWLHIAAINPRIAQTQLLDGPAFAIAMERLRLAGYDHIVVDAPPVLGSADVNLMADAADSVVFALRARRSTTRDLRRAIDQLGDKKIAGSILLLER